jgi:hypothetical protein
LGLNSLPNELLKTLVDDFVSAIGIYLIIGFQSIQSRTQVFNLRAADGSQRIELVAEDLLQLRCSSFFRRFVFALLVRWTAERGRGDSSINRFTTASAFGARKGG